MIARYFETLRWLRAAQIVSRVRLRAGARARRLLPGRAQSAYARRVRRAGVAARPGGLGRALAATLIRHRLAGGHGPVIDGTSGRFTFLNTATDLGWPPDWSAPRQTRLWRYHLHYFDALHDLPSTLAAEEAGLAIMADWVVKNPVHGRGATPDAWHPYVVSLRIVNWMLALSAWDAAVPPGLNRSLVEQALFLERNLESDVGGNHLLKNLKGMVAAGCFWSGATADRWRRKFEEAFMSELERQLLADGGHYELSPMYHAEILADAIEVAAILEATDRVERAQLRRAVARMRAHLRMVTHPDGEIALFNDSAFAMAATPASLHAAAEELVGGGLPPEAVSSETAAKASGFVALPADVPHRYLVADVGPVCPDNLPAHAHADLLSFELSLNNKRIIVNAGVGEYAAGPWRDYYRSTRAHNTVSVDGAEQSDCWGSFRVGRRARPLNVSVKAGPSASDLQAEHTGFDRLRVRHRRRFEWSGGSWAVHDTLLGTGRHSWASFCHLHPQTQVVGRDASSIHIERDGISLEVRWHGFTAARLAHGETDPLQGWYAERFGPAVPATVLVLTGEGALPAEFGYALIPR